MKIDLTKIPNYENLSKEELIEALANYEIEEPNANKDQNSNELSKLKSLLDKANSEAAKYRKELRDTKTKEEQEALDRASEMEAMKQELAELKKEKTFNEYLAHLVNLGYSKDLAKACANAMLEGNSTKVFELQGEFLKQYANDLKKDALKNQIIPNQINNTPNTKPIDKPLHEFTYKELEELKNTNIADFNKLIGKEN